MDAQPQPRALRFATIEINRLDGLGEPFALDDLVAGVNVVHAPNGTGKTRTAHAMNLLLWPKMPRTDGDRMNERLAAEVMIGPDRRRVTLDAGARRWADEHGPVAEPNLPPADQRDRYDLSLAALLQAEGAGFARQLQAESDGGYDLDRAASDLGLKPAISGRLKATNEFKAYEAAKRDHADAVSAAERLLGDEDRLSQLAADRRDAEAAADQVRAIDRQLAVLTARTDAASARRALADFPRAMARLTGREADDLAAIRSKLRSAHQARRDAAARAESARHDLERAAVPEGFDGPRIAAILKRVDDLKDRRRIADAHAAEAARAAAKLAATAADLGAGPNAEVAGVDSAAVRAAEDFSHRSDAATAAFAAAAEAAAELVGGPSPAGELAAPPDRLRDGARSLRAWLREPAADDFHAAGWADPRHWLLVAAIAVVVLALLLAWLVGTGFAVVALLGGWLAFVAVRRSDDVEQAVRPVLVEQYRRLNLPAPAAWKADAVEALCDRLEEAHAAAVEAARREERRHSFEQRRERARPALERIEAERRALVERYGAAPASGPAGLALWMKSLAAHREAAAAHAAATAGAMAARAAFDEDFAAIADELRPLGRESADLPAAEAAAEELAARRADADRAASALGRALADVGSSEEIAAALADDVAAVFAGAGLAEADEPELAELLARLPTRSRAASELYAARDRLARAESAAGDFVEIDADELKRERDRLQSAAETAGDLKTEIALIESHVRAAKRGHDLADALAHRDAAADALRVMRDADRAAVAGWALVERLRRARDRDHRPVFARARELFAEITRGRWVLGVSEGEGGPTFYATDTEADEVRPLAHLSGGTRVQLLLAVRLAFVERQEGGVAVPLFMDETLANSDDARAREVIAAAAAVVRAGRQVFYFTAQMDEVRKWRQCFSEWPDVPLKVVDLATARRLCPAAEPFAPAEVAAPPDVPDPTGMSRAEYAAALGVPKVHPSRGVGSAHVFHLFHDAADFPALRQLLRDGIRTWGQWRTVAERGGGGELFEKASAVAAVLAEVIRLRTVGHGVAVDRHALVESAAVSDNFIEAAVALAEQLQGDAAALISAIEAGALSRFRKSNLEELRAFFAEHGHLPEDAPLSRGEARVRIVGMASSPVLDGCMEAVW